ncbi:hypothetical protein [Amycolatopsis alba]|uniref:Uncharacterized protein n=1 Tax=Amycolatopsis alba DSM 44262 TaxID=1125972 RepID=A0A229RLI8_AMYAL|nr:hypothetical protein [Amycolatopsis alba]OXM47520.1 hypothetical protein CFP75_23850 [Amycolatopsis alba DSM 44262]
MTVFVFHDEAGLHTIGVNDPEQAYGLMVDHAEEQGLEMSEEDPRDIRFQACVNARLEEGIVKYDPVPDQENALRHFLLDWQQRQCGNKLVRAISCTLTADIRRERSMFNFWSPAELRTLRETAPDRQRSSAPLCGAPSRAAKQSDDVPYPDTTEAFGMATQR